MLTTTPARRWAGLLLAAPLLLSAASDGPPPPAPPVRTVPNHAFRSAAQPDAPALVWAVGDGAEGSAAARALARTIAAERPDRFLYLGDVYEHGTAAEFRANYDAVYGALAPRTAPTPGNHEWAARAVGYNAYWRRVTGAPTPPWYAVDLGGWRLLSLNSEAPHGLRSPQLRWVRRQLARRTGTCVLAFWHRPLQNAGVHGDQADVLPLWQALRGRARLMLNGHDHNLQRMRPRDGIVQLIAGAGGVRRYRLHADRRLRFGDDRTVGGLRIRLRPGRAHLAFVAVGGRVLDRSSVRCARGASRSGSAAPGPDRGASRRRLPGPPAAP